MRITPLFTRSVRIRFLVFPIQVLLIGSPLWAQDIQQAGTARASSGLVKLLIVQDLETAVSGARMVRAPSVRVVDGSGKGLSAVVVRAVAGATRETLGQDEGVRNFEAVTDSTGTATFRDLVFTGRPRSLQLGFRTETGTLSGVTKVSIVAPAARRVSVGTPIPPFYQLGTAIAHAPRATVVSVDGQPLSGVRVSIVAASNSVLLSGFVAETDDHGDAEFKGFAMDVACSAGGCPAVKLYFQSEAAKSDTMVVQLRAPLPSRAELPTLGGTFTVDDISALSIGVQVFGPEGLSSGGAAGIGVELRAAGYGQVGIGTTDEHGVASITPKTWRPRAGTVVVSAVSGGREIATKTITITAGSAAGISIVHQPPPRVMVDSAFHTHPTVKVVDRAGNPLTGVGVRAELCGRKHGDQKQDRHPDDVTCMDQNLRAELTGSLIATTNETGEAEFKDLSLHGLDGQYWMKFSVESPGTDRDSLRTMSAILDYNPDILFDRSYVTISAIKSIAGIIPDNEFFDLRFRFRVAPRMHILAATDLSLTSRGTDSVKSTQKTLTEGGVMANLEVHRRRDPVSDIPERAAYLGGEVKVFNTIPYYGVHVGNVELGGSPFHGSSATFALLYRAYRNQFIVGNDTIQPAPRNLMADFYLRSSQIEFFKLLTVRGSILMPLTKEGHLSSRLTIAVPVGRLDIF